MVGDGPPGTRQVSSCGCRTFYICHPKQALAGVGQPGGRAGVVTPRGGSHPAPGLTLPWDATTDMSQER